VVATLETAGLLGCSQNLAMVPLPSPTSGGGGAPTLSALKYAEFEREYLGAGRPFVDHSHALGDEGALHRWSSAQQLVKELGSQSAQVRCAFLKTILHARMPLVPTHARSNEASMRVVNDIPLGCP
jgi:hypothetical protein